MCYNDPDTMLSVPDTAGQQTTAGKEGWKLCAEKVTAAWANTL